MICTTFDCLSANLHKSKTPETYHNRFLINCSRLINLKNLVLGPGLCNHAKDFLKILSISISWLSLMTKFKRNIQNYFHHRELLLRSIIIISLSFIHG